MKVLAITWAIAWNLFCIIIFLGALTVAATRFELLAIASLALIYTSVVTHGLFIVSTQYEQDSKGVNRYVGLLRILGDEREQALIEISDVNKAISLARDDAIFEERKLLIRILSYNAIQILSVLIIIAAIFDLAWL